MKTLLITKTLTRGGASSGARNLLNALRAAGAEVTALDGYARQRRHPLRAVRIAERLYERSVHDAETHCLRLGPPVFDLKWLYDLHRPDIIQLCDVSGNTIRFADISRVPCPVAHRLSDFWPYHGARHYAEHPPARPGPADRLLRRLVFDGGAMPDCRVAPSHWLADRLGDTHVEVIRNAVNIPGSAGPRGAQRGPLRFGFISGQVMDPRKGFMALPRLLDAFGKSASVKVELHIFGRMSPGQVPGPVHVAMVTHGHFPPGAVSRVYDSFDILLCPSHLDNSPNVVSEALAHGVPVIGQKGTGIDSYIQSGTGVLIDFHSGERTVPAFASATQQVLDDYAGFSRRAQAYAKDQLSPLVIGEQYLSLFHRLSKSG